MNRRMVPTSVAVLLGLFLSANSTPTLAQPSPLTIPDKELLLTIANGAIRARLPSVRLEDLELRYLSYAYGLNNQDNAAKEDFDVEFRVRGSKRQAEEAGAAIFEVDSVDVTIELDGRIGKGGVYKRIEKFRSADLKMFSRISSSGTPIWGDPFYPVKLDAPLSKPDRARLREIAVNAVSRFLPTVDTKDLDLRGASFDYMRSPEDGTESEGFWVHFWVKRSVRVTETKTQTRIDRDEITVFISPTGKVDRSGVSTSPSSATYYKHGDITTTPNVPAPKGGTRGPDLTSRSVTFTPNPIHVGDKVTFTYTIDNIGDAAAPAKSYEVEFYVDDELVSFDRATTAIPPRQKIIYSKAEGYWHFEATRTGVHKYRVVIIRNDTLKETDKSHNIVTGTFEVRNDSEVR